jgi:hypothetical protein
MREFLRPETDEVVDYKFPVKGECLFCDAPTAWTGPTRRDGEYYICFDCVADRPPEYKNREEYYAFQTKVVNLMKTKQPIGRAGKTCYSTVSQMKV